jgi:hypothetical protein
MTVALDSRLISNIAVTVFHFAAIFRGSKIVSITIDIILIKEQELSTF